MVQGKSYGRGQACVKNSLYVLLVTEAALLNLRQAEPLKLMSTKDGPQPYDAPC